jgi:hypothetical protein
MGGFVVCVLLAEVARGTFVHNCSKPISKHIDVSLSVVIVNGANPSPHVSEDRFKQLIARALKTLPIPTRSVPARDRGGSTVSG